MARRRQEAHPVPQSEAEAMELLGEYVALDRRVLAARLSAEIRIDRIKAERDREIAELLTAQTSWFGALKSWWEAAGHTLAKGRSIDKLGAKIGIRLSPPKLKLARGVKADTVVGWLRTLRSIDAKAMLRTKVELDKQALIKCLRAGTPFAALLTGKGVSVDQADEFFIDTGLDEDAVRAEVTTRIEKE